MARGAKLKIAVTGVADIDGALRELCAEEGPTGINAAMKKACKEAINTIVKPEVLARIPFRYGTLEENIKVRAVKRSRKLVGYRIGFSDPLFKGETFYAGFLEFDTKPRFRKPAVALFRRSASGGLKRDDRRRGGSTGRVEGFSFLRAALYPNQKQIVALVHQRMRELIAQRNRRAK